MTKYGMSMCVLGHAEEFEPYGIAVNALWARTVIQTAELQMIPHVKAENCRRSQIVADAAHLILDGNCQEPKKTGNFYIDEEVLRDHGIEDLAHYSVVPDSQDLLPDLFL